MEPQLFTRQKRKLKRLANQLLSIYDLDNEFKFTIKDVDDLNRFRDDLNNGIFLKRIIAMVQRRLKLDPNYKIENKELLKLCEEQGKLIFVQINGKTRLVRECKDDKNEVIQLEIMDHVDAN